MKTFVIAALLLIAAPAWAQQAATPDPAAAQFHRGTVKLRIGLAIAGAGLIAMPLTTVSNADRSHNDVGVYAGLGAVFVGGAIAWSGAQDRRRALHPQTAIGFVVGRTNSVRIWRSW